MRWLSMRWRPLRLTSCAAWLPLCRSMAWTRVSLWARKRSARPQQFRRLFAIRPTQGELAILGPGLGGLLQRLAHAVAGRVFIQQLGVFLDAGDAAVELAGSEVDTGFAADHQIVLGDALAEHALHAGAVDRLGVADGGQAGRAGGQQAEQQGSGQQDLEHGALLTSGRARC